MHERSTYLYSLEVMVVWDLLKGGLLPPSGGPGFSRSLGQVNGQTWSSDVSYPWWEAQVFFVLFYFVFEMVSLCHPGWSAMA